MSALDALIERYARADLEEAGPLAYGVGTALARAFLGMPVAHLGSFAPDAHRRALAFLDGVLADAAAIDPAALAPDDALTLLVFRSLAERRRDALRDDRYSSYVTPYASFAREVALVLSRTPLASAADRARHLELLAQVPPLARQVTLRLREQHAAGIVAHAPQIGPAAAALRALAADPAAGALAVQPARLAPVPPVEAERFVAAVRDAIAQRIRPAFEEIASLLESWRGDAPPEVGVGRWPDGEAYYARLVRYNTTLDRTVEAIHAGGMRALAEIEEEMARIRDGLGFRGDRDAFHAALRADPARHARDPAEIGARLLRATRAYDALLDTAFLRRPRAAYDARRLRPELEPTMTYGYYQIPTAEEPLGIYYYNGAHPDRRLTLPLAAIALHELVPGHHYEFALAAENTALPAFRRTPSVGRYVTAYHEGWAEYASELGVEAGVYEDSYDRYGRCALDAMTSARLVVDTGLNALGWDRERAAAFLRAHTLNSEDEIASELLRYGADLPGQALAYKIGMLHFRAERRRAREALGARFDLRRFHDAIVREGGMPLPLVSLVVDRYVEESATA